MTTYTTYRLADDEATYGPNAGKSIVTTDDLGTEVSGPMREVDASRLATALNSLVDAERFIRGFEGDELQEGIDDLLARIRAAISHPEPAPPRYTVARSTDGVDETFDVLDGGEHLVSVPFWAEAGEAEATARRIADALNAWRG